MGRPRSFDEVAVLDAAATEFRVHGFADTSTEQLCEAAGVRRSSLYNTFTSKEELFVQALEHYTTSMRERQAVVLADATMCGADRLRVLMALIIEEERTAVADDHAAGCMTVHAFMSPDLRERNPRVDRILDRDLRLRLSLLEQAVRDGQDDGSIPAGVNARDSALLVTTVISGLRVTAQAGTDPDALQRIATASLHSLLA